MGGLYELLAKVLANKTKEGDGSSSQHMLLLREDKFWDAALITNEAMDSLLQHREDI